MGEEVEAPHSGRFTRQFKNEVDLTPDAEHRSEHQNDRRHPCSMR